MHYIKIPKERIGVLVGTNGKTKSWIEEKTGVSIHIDSKAGDVTIDDQKAEPIQGLKAGDIVKAIARGFSPKKAFKLLDDDIYLEYLDIREYVGKKRKHVERIRSRVIGTKGKTWKTIEMLSGIDLSVYGNTIGIIGDFTGIEIAKHALELLLRGSEHSTVYKYLENKRREMKMAELGI